MAQLTYPLDKNASLFLEIESAPEGMPGKARIYSNYSSQSQLAKNILPLISIATPRTTLHPTQAEFEIPPLIHGQSYRLQVNDLPFAEFEMLGGQLHLMEHPQRQLSVFETRMIGRAPQTSVPYEYQPVEKVPSPLTDLHTHLSGQVSAHDLLELGKHHEVLYPTVALDKLGIEYPKDDLRTIPKRVFLPLAHRQIPGETTESAVPVSQLSPEALAKLKNAMSLSPDTQSTYEDMEVCYYLREPFTKDVKLLPDILRKVALEYKEHGIQYAELSSNAVIDPNWLKVVHDVLPGIERETGVQLRFLAGLPRNLDEASLSKRIAQIQQVADSPYVVGVDILGYEMNKTSDLQMHLEELAAWMRDQHPDMILRMHAGENPKNTKNVKQSLELAERFGIRMRVGHAVYGIDEETVNTAKRLSKSGKLIIEFNPDSNLAVNNIDYPEEVPILQFMHEGVPSVLSSDGASLYRTSAQQTAMAGLFCGVAPSGFKFIRDTEKKHIAVQQQHFDKKMAALPSDFFEKLNQLASLPTPATAAPAPAKLARGVLPSWQHKSDKRPILIAGAAGSSWDIISPKDKKEIIIGLKMMLEHADPEKVCFVTGRTKDRGVGIEMGKAIADYNKTHKKKFEYIMILAESQNVVEAKPKGVSQKLQLDVPLVFLPNAILNFIKDHNGMAYFAGGRSFTRDFIVEAVKGNIPCGLMDQVAGASSEKARVFRDHAFTGAVGMLEHAMKAHPDLFTQGIDLPALAQAYTQHSKTAAARLR